jgi:hypothetical protein
VILDTEPASDIGSSGLHHPGEKRVNHPGFSDPGLAGHEHEPALPAGGSRQMLMEAR